MTKRKRDTRWMVGVALMAAIVILLANTPLGMIPLPVTKATTVHVPVILGSIVLGPLAGGILGSGACAVLGLPEGCMINFLLLGMVGMFSGIVRAPITGVILVAEMSGSLTQFIGLVIVSAVSALTANMLGSKPVYDELLENMLRDRNKAQQH